MARSRSLALVAALTGVQAGCIPSSPPERSSPVLEEAEAPFEPACREAARPSGGCVLDCDGGLWRLTKGTAEKIADGGPVASQGPGDPQPPFAVGDDESAWALEPATGLVHAWGGAGWVTHDIPAAIGFDWKPTIDSLAVRSKVDVYALLHVDSSLQVLGHWDGVSWTSQELKDMGVASLQVTPSFLFLLGNELTRLAADGSSEPIVLDNEFHDTIAIVGDASILLGSQRGLFQWKGSKVEQVYEGPELKYFTARAEDDAWGVWREEDGKCLDSEYSGCMKSVSYWRQYRAFHWDGARVVEAGHVDRTDDSDVMTYLGGGSSPEVIVPSGKGQAWINVEGWVHASR